MKNQSTMTEMKNIEQAMRKKSQNVTPISKKQPLQSTYIMIDIFELTGASTNRDLRKNNLKNLTRSILANGLKHPITINENRLIINGHHRVEVHKKLAENNEEYRFIKANVVAGLTEEDVILYNNEDLKWTGNDFYDKLKNDWLNQYKNYGFSVTNFKNLLSKEIKQIITRKSINYEDLSNYDEIEAFIHNVYLPIYENAYNPTAKIYKGKHRFLPDIIHEATLLDNIDMERLMENSVKYWAEINSCGTSKKAIRTNFVKYYNLNLRDKNKKLLLNDDLEFKKA